VVAKRIVLINVLYEGDRVDENCFSFSFNLNDDELSLIKLCISPNYYIFKSSSTVDHKNELHYSHTHHNPSLSFNGDLLDPCQA